MRKTDTHPHKLYVYECHGPAYPQEEPSFEGFLGIWPEPPYYYFFCDRPASSPLQRWLEHHSEWSAGETYQLDYHQWQQTTHHHQRVGPFVIQTGLLSSSDDLNGGVPIRLNTGLAFGSGLHPSTRGCLLSIADLYTRFSPREVVDLGTGTGILAIACSCLGARSVLALDCNFLAMREARANVQANLLQNPVHFLAAQTLNAVRGKGDLLLMNLEWPCLQRVLQEDDWCRYRWAVLSGFLKSQEEELRRLLPLSSSVISRRLLDGWVTLVVENTNPVQYK